MWRVRRGVRTTRGDEAGDEMIGVHDAVAGQAIADHGGRVVKGTGDGCLATFESARSAVAAGIAIQQELEHRGGRDPGAMRVRIGINAGEVGDRDGDMLGEAVNAAARIMAEARGGEILISRVVRDLVGTTDFVYVDRGDHILKGFPEPWRLYAVNWVSPETPVSRLQVRLLGDVFVTLDDVPLRGFESVRLQRLLARAASAERRWLQSFRVGVRALAGLDRHAGAYEPPQAASRAPTARCPT